MLKLLLPVLIVTGSVMVFMQLKASRPEPTAMQAEEKQWPVSVASATRGANRPVVSLFGRLESPNQSTLSAVVAAEVVEVRVREGDLVEEDQLLILQNSSDLELALRQRQSELAELNARVDSELLRYQTDQALLKEETVLLNLARRSLERVEKLARTKAGSESGVDDARQVISTRSLAIAQRRQSIDDHGARMAQLKAGIERVEAQMNQVRQDLDRTLIRAPYAGRITQVHVSEGEWSRSGDRLVDLFDTSVIEVRAQIPEKYLPAIRQSIQEAQQVEAWASIEGRDFQLSLNRLAGQIRQGQGGLDAFFSFVDDNRQIEVGRVLSLRVSLPPVENSFKLPVTALYGSNTVYRVVDGRLENVPVQYLGDASTEQGLQQVLIGSEILNQGDRVITTQIPAAVNSLKVSIRDQ